MKQIVQKVKKCYVGSDCVQIMVPYIKEEGVTIFDKKGIVYNHKSNCPFITDRYIHDERRFQFPYHNIPRHHGRNGLEYANQLLDFNTPYIRLHNKGILESYAYKENGEAFIINRSLPISVSSRIMNREELEKTFMPSISENEKLYYAFLDSRVLEEYNLPDENRIKEFIKDEFKQDIEFLKTSEVFDNYPTFAKQFLGDSGLLAFANKSLENFSLSDHKFNVLVNYSTILLVKATQEDISIKGFDVWFLTSDSYKVDIYDIPVAKYSLDYLKTLNVKTITPKDPKISLGLNPKVTKEDIKSAKKMVKSLM